MPKLPPESGGMRSRIFGPGTRSARAITGCVLNGPWKFAMQSKLSSAGLWVATTTKHSIGVNDSR